VAARRIRDAERLDDHPATATAVARGEVSERQAAEIARTDDAVPGSEGPLLERARGASFNDVDDEARRIRAAAMDPARLRARQRALTRLFTTLQDEGMVGLHVSLPPEIGIALVNQLDHDTDRLVREARRAGGEVRRRDHYRALALLELIAGPGWAPRVEVVVVAGPEDHAAASSTADSAAGTDASAAGTDPGQTWVREPVRRPRRRPAATEANEPPPRDEPPPGEAEEPTTEARSSDEPADDNDDDLECARAVAPRPPAHERDVGLPSLWPQSRSPGDPHLTVVVSAGALGRGTLEEGELCHVIGGGPTAPSLARELLAGGAFLVGVVHDGRTTTHVERFGRRSTVPVGPGFAEVVRAAGTELASIDLGGRQSSADLRTALLVGDAPGFAGAACSDCGRRFGLAFDHRNPVANNGRTRWDNVDPKCWDDHDHKTRADRRDRLYGGVTPTAERNLPRRR
jgi:hypothetical protein